MKGLHMNFLWYAPDETDPTYKHMVAEGYDE